MCARQFGCIGTYLMFAYIIDFKKSMVLRRAAEIILGIFLFSYVYMINDTKEVSLYLTFRRQAQFWDWTWKSSYEL